MKLGSTCILPLLWLLVSIHLFGEMDMGILHILGIGAWTWIFLPLPNCKEVLGTIWDFLTTWFFIFCCSGHHGVVNLSMLGNMKHLLEHEICLLIYLWRSGSSDAGGWSWLETWNYVRAVWALLKYFETEFALLQLIVAELVFLGKWCCNWAQ